MDVSDLNDEEDDDGDDDEGGDYSSGDDLTLGLFLLFIYLAIYLFIAAERELMSKK